MDNIKISLAAARVNAGLTQLEVSSILGVSKQTVCNWESGKTAPNITQARRLSDVYQMPLDYIYLPA